jgi:uncharacterized membrane protein
MTMYYIDVGPSTSAPSYSGGSVLGGGFGVVVVVVMGTGFGVAFRVLGFGVGGGV